MSADKRILVAEETRKALHDLKERGQTYDELLRELAQRQRRAELEDRLQQLEDAERDELTPLEVA